MTALLDQYRSMTQLKAPAIGVPLAALSSPGAVCITDTVSALSGDADDVYEYLSGNSSDGGRVRPIYNDGSWNYLHLFHVWHSDDPADTIASTAGPKIRVFGQIPKYNRGKRVWPQDSFTSNVVDVDDISTYGEGLGDDRIDLSGLWIPLTKPGYTAGTPELQLEGTAIRHLHNSDSDITVTSEGQFVYLQGCRNILVVMDTVPTFSGGTGTREGVVLGVFSS